jgi:hypothetical protein
MYQHEGDTDPKISTPADQVPRIPSRKRLLSIREGGQETRNLSSVKENTGNINIRLLSKK